MIERDLGWGAAGIIFALAELARELPDPDALALLPAAAHRLRIAPSHAPAPLPGLYVGEAGIGAALLRAAESLHCRELLAAAEERGRQVAALPHTSPDLYHGSAGRLRFHLMLWDSTGKAEHLAAARAVGVHLVNTAEHGDAGKQWWRIPDGYESASGRTFTGYAHGAAGIGDALLDLYDATGDACFAAVAAGAARWLMRLAFPNLDDGSGLDWPSTEGGSLPGPFWCHGAAGIGRFFLHAASLGLVPGAEDCAMRAARAAAFGARWAGPAQCHGLAGNIELLLDVYRATGDRAWLNHAHDLARLLEAFAVERDGLLMWRSDNPDVITPDLMLGHAGIALCLLRLSDPARLPHALGRLPSRDR
jgi:lantibiotic modifying enzyme